MLVKPSRSAGGPQGSQKSPVCVALNELRYKVRREKLSFIKVERKGTKKVGTGNIFQR